MFNFSERLKSIMHLKSVSGSQLAKGINVTQSLISKLLNNKCSPSYELIDSICAYLNVSLSDFFNEEVDSKSLHTPLPLTPTELEVLDYFKKLNSKEQKLMVSFMKALIDK